MKSFFLTLVVLATAGMVSAADCAVSLFGSFKNLSTMLTLYFEAKMRFQHERQGF